MIASLIILLAAAFMYLYQEYGLRKESRNKQNAK